MTSPIGQDRTRAVVIGCVRASKDKVAADKSLRWFQEQIPSVDAERHFLVIHARLIQLETAVPRWIPVSERLPELNQRVLVYDPTVLAFPRNDTHTVIGHYRGAHHLCGEWFVPDGYGKVTHWMPLPTMTVGDAIPGYTVTDRGDGLTEYVVEKA